MKLREIYEKVILRVRMEERRFFNHFNDTITELEALYPQRVCDGVFTPFDNLNDDCNVKDLYGPAIVDDIIFLAGEDNDGTYKSEFLRKSQNAAHAIEKKDGKARRIRKRRW